MYVREKERDRQTKRERDRQTDRQTDAYRLGGIEGGKMGRESSDEREGGGGGAEEQQEVGSIIRNKMYKCIVICVYFGGGGGSSHAKSTRANLFYLWGRESGDLVRLKGRNGRLLLDARVDVLKRADKFNHFIYSQNIGISINDHQRAD